MHDVEHALVTRLGRSELQECAQASVHFDGAGRFEDAKVTNQGRAVNRRQLVKANDGGHLEMRA
jgi:hypothetical protein